MKKDIESIIAAARELSELIENLPVTLEYRKMQSSIQQDPEAINLLQELISRGAVISREMSEGTRGQESSEAENAILNEKLESKPLVKDFLKTQKEYLLLLQQVVNNIKNPQNN